MSTNIAAMWQIIEDTSKESRHSLAWVVPLAAIGLAACFSTRQAFISSSMSGVECLVWWIGLICLSVAVGFVSRSIDNNRQRNSMYVHMLFNYEHIQAQNIPPSLLWLSLCGGVPVQYDESLLPVLLRTWEEELRDADEPYKFSVFSYARSVRLARELGIADMMEAVKRGVPAEDVFC